MHECQSDNKCENYSMPKTVHSGVVCGNPCTMEIAVYGVWSVICYVH